MNISTSSARGRLVAGLLATSTLAISGLAALGSPAQSADPTGDCATAYPVSDLTKSQAVTGKTVSSGVAPDAFSGEVLGVLDSGIAPGLDMVMARLTSPEIDRVGGIWQGMSGSPVYAEDGRLIGAVAYGLAVGPSPVAGITPFAEMDDYLGRSAPRPAAKVRVSDSQARAISRESDVSRAQASQGFSQLPVPMGVTGISQARLDQARDYARERDLGFLGSNLFAANRVGGTSERAAEHGAMLGPPHTRRRVDRVKPRAQPLCNVEGRPRVCT